MAILIVKFSHEAFGSNLTSVSMNMFSYLICFMKAFYKCCFIGAV
jgi:hypothetical protein